MGNKVNYQKEMELVLRKTGDHVPKLLLHVCCAPCSSYCLEYLSEFFEITVFYYNPNIAPESEYRFRTEEEKRFIQEIRPKHPIHFIEGNYDPDRYYEMVSGLEQEPEGGARCSVCFAMRLEESARLCKEGGYDFFTTTLTISPLKDADRLNTIGMQLAKQYGVAWLPSDFKKRGGYQRSIELSKEHHLYRQNYCGCVFSKEEAQKRMEGRQMN